MRALPAALLAASLVAGCTAAESASKPAPSGPSGPSTGVSASPHGSQTAPSPPSKTQTAKPFDRTRHSLKDPTSIWVIVNKTHPISPSDFEPHIALVRGYQVATSAAPDLTRLLNTADRHGVRLKIASAYRSYGYQEAVHANLEASVGLDAADGISARAGYSEHQTGLAVDLELLDGECALHACFAHTHAGRWLARKSWKFGFVVRYTRANSSITGYSPEPWHFRYVGKALARELHADGVGSLEEFFGVRGGDYPDSR